LSYSTVKIGDTIEPYRAAVAEDDRLPLVLGERHRIQIPHQHIILEALGSNFQTDHNFADLLSKVRWMARPSPNSSLHGSILEVVT
jgi:hypothetical protein